MTENDSQTCRLHSCLCLLVSSFRSNQISSLLIYSIYMSNDLISHHTSLAFRCPWHTFFWLTFPYIIHKPARNHSSPHEPLRWGSSFHFSLQKQPSSQKKAVSEKSSPPSPTPLPSSPTCVFRKLVSLSRRGGIIRPGLLVIPLLAKQSFIRIWCLVWHLFDAGAPAFVSMNHLSAKVAAF